MNPDGDDTSAGAVWERGTPERTEITAGSAVQPEGAHGGSGAWVTGASARAGARDFFVRAGRTTLESPVFEGADWREPRVRYWVSFAGMKAARQRHRGGAQPRLPPARAGPGAWPAPDWIEIDRLEDQIDRRLGAALGAAARRAAAARPFQLRFVAEDANPANGGVEAAIDDLRDHLQPARLLSAPAPGTEGRRLRPGRGPDRRGPERRRAGAARLRRWASPGVLRRRARRRPQ